MKAKLICLFFVLLVSGCSESDGPKGSPQGSPERSSEEEAGVEQAAQEILVDCSPMIGEEKGACLENQLGALSRTYQKIYSLVTSKLDKTERERLDEFGGNWFERGDLYCGEKKNYECRIHLTQKGIDIYRLAIAIIFNDKPGAVHPTSVLASMDRLPEEWYRSDHSKGIVGPREFGLATLDYYESEISYRKGTPAELIICEEFLTQTSDEIPWSMPNVYMNSWLGYERYCLNLRERQKAAKRTSGVANEVVKSVDVSQLHMFYLFSDKFPKTMIAEYPDCHINKWKEPNGQEHLSFEYDDFLSKCGLEESSVPVIERGWVSLIDHYYDDVDGDGKLELIVSYLNDGPFSALADRYKVILSIDGNGELEAGTPELVSGMSPGN